MRVISWRVIVLGLTCWIVLDLAGMAVAQWGGANAGGFGASYGYQAGGIRGRSTNGYAAKAIHGSASTASGIAAKSAESEGNSFRRTSTVPPDCLLRHNDASPGRPEEYYQTLRRPGTLYRDRNSRGKFYVVD